MNRTIVHLLALTAVAGTLAAGLIQDAAAVVGGAALAGLTGALLLTKRHLFDAARGRDPQPVPVRVRVDGRRLR